jgi:RNA polymerase sigma factor (sigma-70 family)
LTLNEIISGCKAKKRTAQNALVQQFAPMLLGICRRYCRGEEAAHDALQDSFVNIFSYIDSINDINTAEAWMRKIAVNCCISLHRKKMMPMYAEIDESLEWANVELPSVLDSLHVEELLQVIDHLPDHLYLVFNLYVVEGYSHKEIGEILKIGESSSRSYLVRARRTVVEILQKNYKEDYIHYIEKRSEVI